ncbi:hypothetical protein NP493_857g00011 [Ridgeia piscesae]|uniref:Uncharacterized protein n=1 Tax=Ridgeia piscesae TaxID=27915 RepID=A0AAD9NM69_RIDPI|nr:hypothetical protein NP493_857g00011 [Ridgeia piscesae]
MAFHNKCVRSALKLSKGNWPAGHPWEKNEEYPDPWKYPDYYIENRNPHEARLLGEYRPTPINYVDFKDPQVTAPLCDQRPKWSELYPYDDEQPTEHPYQPSDPPKPVCGSCITRPRCTIPSARFVTLPDCTSLVPPPSEPYAVYIPQDDVIEPPLKIPTEETPCPRTAPPGCHKRRDPCMPTPQAHLKFRTQTPLESAWRPAGNVRRFAPECLPPFYDENSQPMRPGEIGPCRPEAIYAPTDDCRRAPPYGAEPFHVGRSCRPCGVYARGGDYCKSEVEKTFPQEDGGRCRPPETYAMPPSYEPLPRGIEPIAKPEVGYFNLPLPAKVMSMPIDNPNIAHLADPGRVQAWAEDWSHLTINNYRDTVPRNMPPKYRLTTKYDRRLYDEPTVFLPSLDYRRPYEKHPQLTQDACRQMANREIVQPYRDDELPVIWLTNDIDNDNRLQMGSHRTQVHLAQNYGSRNDLIDPPTDDRAESRSYGIHRGDEITVKEELPRSERARYAQIEIFPPRRENPAPNTVHTKQMMPCAAINASTIGQHRLRRGFPSEIPWNQYQLHWITNI